MIGTSSQEDVQMLRQAQIAKYLNLLYEDAFQDWQKKATMTSCSALARHAMALQKFSARRKCRPARRRWRRLPISVTGGRLMPMRRRIILNQFAEAEASRKFLKDPRTSKWRFANSPLAHFTPDEFPTQPDASGIDDARPDGRGARPDHGNRDAHFAVGVADGNTTAACSTARATCRSPAKSRTSSWATSRSRPRNSRQRQVFSSSQSRRPAKHIMTLPRAISEAEHLHEGGCPFSRHSWRSGNCPGILRPVAEVQLLEHFHRPAICAIQAVAHPLRSVWELPPVFPHAPE